jgi:acetyltransferase-like isoleucine patch superfamily enzyme
MPIPTPTPIPPRRLPWDWYPGTIPGNVIIDDTAYVETSFSFHLFRSEEPAGVRIGRGASTYLGTMFDVGPRGRVTLGDFALVHGARIICDREVTIGASALISWNVVVMDCARWPLEPRARRRALERAAACRPGWIPAETPARPVAIGPNVWIGFECCILPGVTIGEGAVVGARSVVAEDVEPYTLVAGNPARRVRRLEEGAADDAR